jgi:hypothetical protein
MRAFLTALVLLTLIGIAAYACVYAPTVSSLGGF